MKLFYEYMVIFFNLSPTPIHLHPLQAENCDSNSRLVVDEDDNIKSGLKGLNPCMNLLEMYLFLILFNFSKGHSSIYLKISGLNPENLTVMTSKNRANCSELRFFSSPTSQMQDNYFPGTVLPNSKVFLIRQSN